MYTENETRAHEFAREVHKTQTRKGGEIPYVTHLESVAAILKSVAASEEQVMAGFLHDTIEDQGIEQDFLSAKFGPEVARIVQCCTEQDRTLPWKSRKEMTVAKLPNMDDAALLVAQADKLSNLQDTLADLKSVGESLWERFNAGKAEQVWYYDALGRIFLERSPQSELTKRYTSALQEFKILAFS